MLHFDQLEGRPVLTQREQQILELVAIGLSAKEVALEISIAPRTVERHIENIRLKMRARNRTHMVTCAAMAGLLTANSRPSAPMGAQPIEAEAVPIRSNCFLLNEATADIGTPINIVFGGYPRWAA